MMEPMVLSSARGLFLSLWVSGYGLATRCGWAKLDVLELPHPHPSLRYQPFGSYFEMTMEKAREVVIYIPWLSYSS